MLNQHQTYNLNNTMSPKEIDVVIKISHPQKSLGPAGFNAEFYQPFKEELITILFKLLHKIETERTLSNSFFEAKVTRITKRLKYLSKKENYRSNSHKNNDAKVLNKTLAI